jgi:hypothetical protein
LPASVSPERFQAEQDGGPVRWGSEQYNDWRRHSEDKLLSGDGPSAFFHLSIGIVSFSGAFPVEWQRSPEYELSLLVLWLPSPLSLPLS